MTTIYKILGYTIIAIAGLINLYLSWEYIVVDLGWVDPIVFLIFFPIEFALVPILMALQGYYGLLLITYGGGAIGYFFIATAQRLEEKSIPGNN